MSFETESGVRYDMPASFGPSVAPPVSRGIEATTAAASFVTDPDTIAALLPKWFEPADRAVITVAWTELANVDWMGGRSYTIAAASAAVRYVAEDLLGQFSLAIWESDCAPIISGREYMGTPKQFGEIPAKIDISAPEIEFDCAEYGSSLLSVSLGGMEAVPEPEMGPIREAGETRVGFTWKYVPGCHGEPDADYPIRNSVPNPWDRAWRGQTERVEFGTPSDREAPYSAKIARALAELPQLELLPAFAAQTDNGSIDRSKTARLA